MKTYTFTGFMGTGKSDVAVTISIVATSRKEALAALAHYGIERVK